MYNFVIFSLSRWNIEYGCNIKDISVELSKAHKVLYIDVPLKRKERWFRTSTPRVKEVEQRIKERKELIEVSENLWHYVGDEILESVNGISNAFLFDVINEINNKRFARSIRKAISAVGFKEYILLNDNDIYNGFHLKKLLSPSLYVYYLRDRLQAMAYWKAQATRLESQLIKEVDLVVANSQYLADGAKEFNPMSYYVGQGCDLRHFLQRPDGDEAKDVLKGIRRPIVGYIGALNSERLDLSLILELAMRMKEFNFVFVGQEDGDFLKSSLHSFRNVFFLGKRDFSELPAFLYKFDVAINPQAVNEITAGNYPRKVDEYLAAGRPVVAAETLAMDPFREHVYLGNNAADFEGLIRKAIEEDTPELQDARRAFATQHTWENSVNRILEAVDRVSNEK
jgi:glycosyltransferase involved in cell wall biosynthesis